MEMNTANKTVKRPSFSNAEHLGMKELDENFKPSENDVICARGKEVYNHEGNRRFRTLVKKHLNTYSSCVTKMQKSRLVNYIVGTVREASPNGGFIKKIDERWYAVTDRHAREKTGQTMRDLLHTRYSSSTKAKARNRQQLREARLSFSSAKKQGVGHDDEHHPGRKRFSCLERALSSSVQPLRTGRSASLILRRSNTDQQTKWASSQQRASVSEPLSFGSSLQAPLFGCTQSFGSRFPLRSASSGPIITTSQVPGDLFDDFSEDLSLDLDGIDPLPLEESSHEFNFDDSTTTRVSDASFSEAVDTLFECLHIQ